MCFSALSLSLWVSFICLREEKRVNLHHGEITGQKAQPLGSGFISKFISNQEMICLDWLKPVFSGSFSV